MRAVRVNAKRLGADLFFESSLRHYLPEYALGTWEVGGPTTHVRDVAGVEPEDFLTIARRYVTGPESRRTAGNLIRQIWNFMLIGLVPMHRLDRFDRLQQHPQPAHPRHSGQSAVWRDEHTAAAELEKDNHAMSTTPSAAASGSSYVLGHADVEVQRLLLQGRLYDDYTEHALRLAGLRPGMRVLDIGCGPGDVSFIAARLVGPTGTVLGVDAAPEMVELARARAAERGLSAVHFTQAAIDAIALDEPVDAVVGRLILMHLPDPAATLRHLARSCAPAA